MWRHVCKVTDLTRKLAIKVSAFPTHENGSVHRTQPAIQLQAEQLGGFPSEEYIRYKGKRKALSKI